MKPIKLVISAFGPYKDKVEIHFSKLGNDGIFLITGDTGSGKTTIFDALSFALFGEASGSRRENGSFRSDFAGDDVSTFVELEFVHKDVIYKIERTPRYMRKKKKGDGTTIVGGDASLTYLDTVVTGDKNVTDKCVSILGMNANQFKQIVMIAQGEFLELLHAKTKERATIFRHIFNTDIYKDISDNLKNKYLIKKREYEDSCISIKGYINGIQLDSELSGYDTVEQALDVLEEEIENDNKIEKSFEDERNVLFKESSKLIKVISEGKIINDSIVSLGKAKERLDTLLGIKNSIEEKEELLKKNRNIWDIIMPKYLELSKLNKEILDKKTKLDSNEKEYSNVLKNYEDVLVKYNSIKDKLSMIQMYNKLVEDAENKISLLNEIDRLNEKYNEIDSKLIYCKLIEKSGILDKFKNCKNQEVEIGKLRDKISNLKNEYVSANEEYGKHYDIFLSAQAGIIACNLKENEPCPVCGSTSHPNLAKMVDDILSKEELDQEKNNLENKYQELENFRLELLDKEKDLHILKEELKGIEEDVLVTEISNLESKCEGIRLNINDYEINELVVEKERLGLMITEKSRDLDSNIDKESLNNDIVEKRRLVIDIEKEIEDIRQNYDKVLSKKANIESLCSVLKNDIELICKNKNDVEDNYIKLYQDLGYSNEDEYIKVKLEKEEILVLENEIKKYKEDLTEVKSNISSLEKIINGKSFVELDSSEEQLKEVNKKLDDINLSIKNINSKISNNKKIYASLKIVSEKTTKLEKEVMIYKDLSDTANGTITGKSKLEFEQYVQASYFDRVLVSANKRLKLMTEERYQLLRKEEATKVSDKLGLELEVMDYYTGKKRDIKSLSGGESFKASLSLALGMSDTIQEFSGGVVVDAMFIDEGFGSLDDESLEQAMNAIMMLSQGNKMIGIISHVNELKARIDKKIVVKKSSSGSSVSLVI